MHKKNKQSSICGKVIYVDIKIRETLVISVVESSLNHLKCTKEYELSKL